VLSRDSSKKRVLPPAPSSSPFQFFSVVARAFPEGQLYADSRTLAAKFGPNIGRMILVGAG